GNDVVEGGDGTDTLVFNGANIAEAIDISANGERVRFFRDIANITMDLNDVERIEFNARGEADTINVGELSGTDVKEVAIDLAAALGGSVGDGQIDSVTVNGTGGDDAVTVASIGSKIVVNGLAAQVTIDHADKTDRLIINGLGGADVIDASGLAAGAIALK